MTDSIPSAGSPAPAAEPTPAELEASIEQLTAYRQRLAQDVVAMGQRLKLPQQQIDHTLAQHAELQRIEAILAQLLAQKSTLT
jgi:uncharacterized Rmd1/YagE family protein